MKIVKPYAQIIPPATESPNSVSWTGDFAELQRIEWCARISHRTEEKMTLDTWRRFLETVVIKHGDWSVVEHISVSVDFLVDRGITHELVRHRLFSFTQESTRFVNYEKKMPPSFIYPQVGIDCEYCLCDNEVRSMGMMSDRWWHDTPNNPNTHGISCAYDPLWLSCIDVATFRYRSLIQSGWRPQEARSVFPNALSSRLIVTGNLRNWRHFFLMRTTAEAHPQMRQVTIPLLLEFKNKFPILFDDIEPNTKQSESIKRGR